MKSGNTDMGLKVGTTTQKMTIWEVENTYFDMLPHQCCAIKLFPTHGDIRGSISPCCSLSSIPSHDVYSRYFYIYIFRV